MQGTDNARDRLARGLGLLASGRPADAVPVLCEVVASMPGAAPAHRALAEAYYSSGQLDTSLQSCERAVSLDAACERSQYLLGVILACTGELRRAAAALTRAVELRENYTEAVRALAAVLNRDGRFERAIACYRRALELGLDDRETRLELAVAAEKHGDTDEAIRQRRVLARRAPDDVDNLFNLAALTGEPPPPVAPRSMVVETFDRYAETFETHLRKLGYQGPELLFHAVETCTPDHGLRVLDLGCGTGLCGELIRSRAQWLVGVDLAPAMIARSRAKGVYDELREADVMDYLRDARDFDLVLAADLLIYIGDLDAVFALVQEALAPGGIFALTLERGEDLDYRLGGHHRYTHAPGYVTAMAEKHGFLPAHRSEHVLRRENETDVPGLVVALARPRP